MTCPRGAGALLALVLAGPVAAQPATPPKPFAVTGSVALVSDYRLRGVSQSDDGPAVQGGLAVAHASGPYAGLWVSNLAGWGTFGGADLELDVIAGYKRPLAGGTVDVGVTWYLYPGAADETDYAEPFARFSGTIGPASLLVGVAYAPRQQALGRWYLTGASYRTGVPDRPRARHDNLYLWSDVGVGIPGTAFTAKAHVGHSGGNRGLGPNGTSVTPTGDYWDWLVGVDCTLGPVVLGLAYTDTDIGWREAAYLQPNLSKGQDSHGPIVGARAVFSISAAF